MTKLTKHISPILLSAFCLTILTPFNVSGQPAAKEEIRTYSGNVGTKNIDQLTVATQHGNVPVMILCNATADDWGLMALYLDQITDDNMRYKRPAGRSGGSRKPAAVVFSSDGAFSKIQGNFPKSDCEEKNILK